MITTRVTQKGQATIPVRIRKFLQLHKGDKVAFEINNDQVVVKKAPPIDAEYLDALQHTLAAEWSSKADNQSYNDL